ncbi:hypothetical protein EJ08DRAFT_206468 [Tothia fuscella]|uniref:Zn(2)-C6 fungal-type domain-containing protein n=1 Tax=Tothia fuscella TaxID=1048955 RepID=A0A9P4TZJ6_9PEZI|nr:hypothetical protein EJ08DRAFT_206468 [Tothia fuscella]
MGGVPGMSGGCNTCRKRKKGCDKQHPFCGQCLRLGIECAGYAKEMKFISFEAKPSRTAKQSALTQRKKSTPLALLPYKCELSAFRNCAYGAFMEFYLPVDDSHLIKQGFCAGEWLKNVPNMAVNNPAIANAFDALATARMALVTNDAKLMTHSSKAYGKALIALQRVISNLTSVISIEVLSCIMLLALYEIYGNSVDSSTAWKSHVQAASSILEFQGRSTKVSYPEMQFLLKTRMERIVHAIGKRKACDLVEPDWTAPPWSDCVKNPAYEIVDIMACMPSVMEDSDALKTCVDVAETLDKATSLANKCRLIWTELEDWHRSQELATVGPRYWEEPSNIRLTKDPDAEDYMFPKRFCFPDPATAYAEIVYWTASLLLASTHYLACVWLKDNLPVASILLQSSDEIFSFDENAELYCRAFESANNIAQSLEYFIKPERGGTSIEVVGFPIAVARGFFEYCNSPKRKWFDVVLKYIRDTRSVPLDTFLNGTSEGQKLTLVRV